MRTDRAPARQVTTGLEVLLAVAVVLIVPTLPSLVLLGLTALSLALRRDRLSSLGLRAVERPGRMAWQVLWLTVGWSAVTVCLTLPLLEHLTGQQQDVSQFADLQGDLVATAVLLALSWTLAALGEELAFRGFLQTRLRELLPAGRPGLVGAVLLSSALFGLIHTEQGLVGVVVAALDGVFFSILRYRYRTLWAAVLAHGFVNSVGVTAYFLLGPVSSPW